MFGNRALQVKMVKTPKTSTDEVNETSGQIVLNPEQISKIARDLVLQTAVAVGSVVVARRVIDIIGNVIEIAAKAKFN